MYQRPCRWLTALLTLAAAGCGTDRAELERVKAELAATRAELRALQANQPAGKPAYLDELERLAALEAKGALTKAEFEARKKTILAMPDQARLPQASVDALAEQCRTLQHLHNTGTISPQELDQKKRQLLQGPLMPGDLKKDLQTVQTLHNQGVITAPEWDLLKERLLGIEKKTTTTK